MILGMELGGGVLGSGSPFRESEGSEAWANVVNWPIEQIQIER